MKYFHGKLIIDSKIPLVVPISRRDINKAIPRNNQCCAIAQSLKRMPDIEEVRVGKLIVLVEKRELVWRYQIEKEDSKKVEAFDIANYFQPGPITLIPPKRKTESRIGTKRGSNKREGKARTVYNAIPLRHTLRISN